MIEIAYEAGTPGVPDRDVVDMATQWRVSLRSWQVAAMRSSRRKWVRQSLISAMGSWRGFADETV
jgi:hypothetical protein